MKVHELKLNDQELQTVMDGLGELRARVAVPVINSLAAQVAAATEAEAKAKAKAKAKK